MKKSVPAASPEAYVASLKGWRRTTVEALRAAIRSAGRLDEVIKWGNVVYLGNGPVLMIRAEAERVLRLRGVEPVHEAGPSQTAHGEVVHPCDDYAG